MYCYLDILTLTVTCQFNVAISYQCQPHLYTSCLHPLDGWTLALLSIMIQFRPVFCTVDERRECQIYQTMAYTMLCVGSWSNEQQLLLDQIYFVLVWKLTDYIMVCCQYFLNFIYTLVVTAAVQACMC